MENVASAKYLAKNLLTFTDVNNAYKQIRIWCI